MIRKVFKTRISEGGWIVVVPTLNKVYLCNREQDIPDYVEDDVEGSEQQILNESIITDFRYPSVMFLLTTNCNLRCIYCYANAGDGSLLIMPWHIIENGLKFIIQNALRDKRDEVWIRFHGGGEPTLAWDNLVKAVKYAKNFARDKIKIRFSITTNGVINAQKREFLANSMDFINLSMDGPAEIQNIQRPLVNGGDSFEQVFETARFFYQHQVKFGIRVTITPFSVTKMLEIVKFFGSNFPGIKLSLEPVDICGRCNNSGLSNYLLPSFVENFLLAQKEAKKYNIRIRYSSVDIRRIGLRYCGLSDYNFIVTPEGYVTACSRVCRKNDPAAETFIFGQFNERIDAFVFDFERYKYLREIKVDNMPECSNCFAAWLCKGDCPMQRYNFNQGKILEGRSPRCEIIKEIIMHQLLENLKLKSIK